MATLLLDSFDHYTSAQVTQKWTQTAGFLSAAEPTLTASAGQRGTYGCRFQQGSDSVGTKRLGITLAPASALAIIGANFRANDFSNLKETGTGAQEGHRVFQFWDASSLQLRVQINSDGTLRVHSGGGVTGGGTLLGTTSRALQTDVTYYIWLKALMDPTNGSVTIRVNGDDWLSLSGVATAPNVGTPFGWSQAYIGPCFGVATSHFDYDDVAILDGSGSVNNDIPCSHLRVDVVYPNADGTYTEFNTLGGGTHTAEVSEGSINGGTGNDGDSTYNETSVVGERDSFTVPAIPVATAAIIAVQKNIIARAPAAGTSSMAGFYRSGGVDYDFTSLGLPTSYADRREISDVNPATGVAWQDADLITPNEWGYRKTA